VSSAPYLLPRYDLGDIPEPILADFRYPSRGLTRDRFPGPPQTLPTTRSLVHLVSILARPDALTAARDLFSTKKKSPSDSRGARSASSSNQHSQAHTRGMGPLVGMPCDLLSTTPKPAPFYSPQPQGTLSGGSSSLFQSLTGSLWLTPLHTRHNLPAPSTCNLRPHQRALPKGGDWPPQALHHPTLLTNNPGRWGVWSGCET